MTSKIKVDNINKVSDDSNIINKCGTTITLGASGDSIALASGASQSGFGREGSVNWQTTPKTSTFTAANGEGYFINSGSALTMNLPAGSAGAIVAVSDYARNFATYNFTISPNGSEKIGGFTDDATLNVNGQAATFVYVDSTKGWINVQNAENTETGNAFVQASGGTETTDGDFKVHTFTGPGTFAVSAAATSAPNNKVCYMVVGGGGGNGFAGGGAGGVRFFVDTTKGIPMSTAPAQPRNGYGSPTPSGTEISLTASSFPITVGAGGASSQSGDANEGSSSIFSTITSTGGGGGGRDGPSGPNFPTYGFGGSGGGAFGSTPPSNPAGSNGNSPPVTPSQGSNGGASAPQSVNAVGYGGGGGFICAGGDGSSGPAPAGGNAGAGGIGGGFPTGLIKSCGGTPGPVGTERYFSGGGGGGSQLNPNPGGTDLNNGGAGGGGDGTRGYTGTPATPYGPGTANTGGGGGGGSNNGGAGGAGGSGIVIIRYKFQ
jgi:hypothetical protein